jgi:hypothetical protein
VVLTCFNHLKKYDSQWEGFSHILWKFMENKKSVKPPTSQYWAIMINHWVWFWGTRFSDPQKSSTYSGCSDLFAIEAARFNISPGLQGNQRFMMIYAILSCRVRKTTSCVDMFFGLPGL